jgi:guanylate kinase
VIPDAVYIFLAPPSLEALLDRITSRGKDSQESISQRMGKAMGEMQTIDRFDYVIVNYDGRLDDAVAQVDAIVMAEKLRVQPRRVEL